MSSGRALGHPMYLMLRQLLSIVVLVRYPPIRNAVVVHLAREGPTARFLHDGGTYWKQSKRVFTSERFCEEVCCTSGRCGLSYGVLEAGVGCTDSNVHEKHRAVVC